MIKTLILDRDGLLTHNSSDPESPFYYILDYHDLIVKPNVKAALAIVAGVARKTGMKVIMATKQRCIGKGLITRLMVDRMHIGLQAELGFWFDAIYVEENEKTKANLFAAILKDTGARPEETMLIDDSPDERIGWQAAGGVSYACYPEIDLYDVVCGLFQIS